MRLIDADALTKKVFPYDAVDKKTYSINAKAVSEAINKAPTVDIKTEVAREIFAEIKSSYKDRIFIDIDELEKRYTEVNK